MSLRKIIRLRGPLIHKPEDGARRSVTGAGRLRIVTSKGKKRSEIELKT
jgi:hypothetical protein